MRSAQNRLRGLLTASLLVSRSTELEEVLRHILGAARHLVGARYCALGVVQHGRLVRFLHEGMEPETVDRIGALPEGKGVLGRLVDDPRALRLTRIDEHPSSVGFPPHHPPMRGFLGVPLRARDQVFGNLYLTEKTDGTDFTAEDEHLILALGSAAGVAIENAMLVAETRHRQAWQTAATRFATDLLSAAAPAEAFEQLVRKAAVLSAGQGAALLEPVDGSDELQVVIAHVRCSTRPAESASRPGTACRASPSGPAALRSSTTVPPIPASQARRSQHAGSGPPSPSRWSPGPVPSVC